MILINNRCYNIKYYIVSYSILSFIFYFIFYIFLQSLSTNDLKKHNYQMKMDVRFSSDIKLEISPDISVIPEKYKTVKRTIYFHHEISSFDIKRNKCKNFFVFCTLILFDYIEFTWIVSCVSVLSVDFKSSTQNSIWLYCCVSYTIFIMITMIIDWYHVLKLKQNYVEYSCKLLILISFLCNLYICVLNLLILSILYRVIRCVGIKI